MSLALKLTSFAFDHAVNVWGMLASVVDLSPLVFRVRITNRCNLSCHYCSVGVSLNQKTENILQLDEWKKIIAHLPRKTLIDLTGGEPMLTPRFEEIIDEMLNRKLKISLITNGTVQKEELFKKFVDKKLAHFMVSFDGNEKKHDEVRGGGNFNKAIASAQTIIGFKRLKKTKYPLMVGKLTLTEDNYLDLESLCDRLFNEIGFDGVTINLLFSNDARNGIPNGQNLSEDKFQRGNVMTFSPEKVQDLANTVRRLSSRFSGKIKVRPDIDLDKIEEYFKNPKSFSPKNCYKYRSVITMYSDGTLTPCDLGLNVGNIRDIHFDVKKSHYEAGIREFFKSFKKSELLPGCQACCLKKQVNVK